MIHEDDIFRLLMPTVYMHNMGIDIDDIGDHEKDEDDGDNGEYNAVKIRRNDVKRQRDALLYNYATFKPSFNFSIEQLKPRNLFISCFVEDWGYLMINPIISSI